jgi:hypothetical protein
MPIRLKIGAAALFCSALLVTAPTAFAHGFAGERFFPATLETDDPFVADEGSLPTLTKNPDGPDGTQSYSIESDISKKLFSDFGLTAAYSANYTQPKGAPPQYGGAGLSLGAQYQLFIDAPHEFEGLFGLDVDVGHTGAVHHGGADDHTTLSPTFDFGKGFGDLPDSLPYIRPFAITGNLGFSVPTRVNSAGTLNQETFNAGFAFEYSLEYLEHHVKDVGLTAPFDRMIPLVEVTSTTPLNRGFNPDGGSTNGTGNATTGLVAPGVIWAGQYTQIGAEALIPYGEGQGHGVGVLVQLHFFIDDLFPDSIGKPIFSDKPLFGR